MTLMILGLLAFTGLHLVPTLAPGTRSALQRRMGENGYKGVASLLVLLSVVLIVFGWRGTSPSLIYTPPASLHAPALALMAIAFLLIVVSMRKSRLRRVIRHPELTGFSLWGIAHLMLNGDNRYLLVLGTIALWTILEIILVSRREGTWVKQSAPFWGAELATLPIAGLVISVLVFIHPWIAGLPVW